MTCNVCNIQYVGQTSIRLMDRFKYHWLNITNQNVEDPIGRHFKKPGHSGYTDVTIHICTFLHANPSSTAAKKLRDRIERNWMHRLKSILPHGLNAME